MNKKIMENHRTHWQWYRDFFSVGILRYFVVWFSLVPLAVHAFGKIPSVVPLKIGDLLLVLRLDLPFNWVLLWVASLCYTLALFIFVLRCPDFIKKYSSFIKYKDYGHSSRWLVWLSHDVFSEGAGPWDLLKERLVKKGYAVPLDPAVGRVDGVAVDAEVTSFQFDSSSSRFVFKMPIIGPNGLVLKDKTDEAEREIFWEVFGAQSGGRWRSRASIIVLLFAALVLFLVVLIQHIWAAVPYVVEEVALLLL